MVFSGIDWDVGPEIVGAPQSVRPLPAAQPLVPSSLVAFTCTSYAVLGVRLEIVVEVPVPENECVRQFPEARYCTS